MTVLALLVAWWALLVLFGWALCLAGGRADRTVEQWDRERAAARDALDAMGSECEVIDFGGWRNRGRDHAA